MIGCTFHRVFLWPTEHNHIIMRNAGVPKPYNIWNWNKAIRKMQMSSMRGSVRKRSYVTYQYRSTYMKGLRGALDLSDNHCRVKWKTLGNNNLMWQYFHYHCWIVNHKLSNNRLYLPSCISMANWTSSSSDTPDDAMDVKMSSRFSSSMLVFKLEVDEYLPRESSLSALRIFILKPLTLLPWSSIDCYWQMFTRPRLLIATAHAHSLFGMSA